MAKMVNFDTSKLLFLRAQLVKTGSKIKLNEWEAYLDWKLGASRQSIDKFLSLQEVKKKILETVSDLKKVDIHQYPIHSPSPAAPLHTLLSELPCPDLSTFLLSLLCLLNLLRHHSLLT